MFCNYQIISIFRFFEFIEESFFSLISFLICVVAQGGSDGLQIIVLFRTCLLANFDMQVVTFSA